MFKGHLPIAYGSALEQFVDHVLKIRRKDFMAFAFKKAAILVEHASASPSRPVSNTGSFKGLIAKTSWSMTSSGNDRSTKG